MHYEEMVFVNGKLHFVHKGANNCVVLVFFFFNYKPFYLFSETILPSIKG